MTDVATFERSTGGVYPAGSIITQISATKGQTYFLASEQMVEKHYAVILPRDVVEPKYLYYSILEGLPEFLAKNQTGLNLQMGALNDLVVKVDFDLDRQQEQVSQLELFEKAIELAELELVQMRDFKASCLGKMFV